MNSLIHDLRESAPVATQAFEYLVVPLDFRREEALSVLSTYVTPNGYNPRFLDTLVATGLVRKNANKLSIPDRTRIVVMDGLSPPKLASIAKIWESLVEQRGDAPSDILERTYLGLLAGKTESALVARAEFAIAEASHAVERQALLARLISQSQRNLSALPQDARASMFYVLGINHYREGRRALAGNFFEQARRTGVRTLDVAICTHLLANLRARSRDRWSEAEALYKDSISMGQDLGAAFHIAQTEHSYADLLAERKRRWHEAEELYKKSLKAGEDLGYDHHVAQTKHSYANLLAKQKRSWPKAEEMYEESISVLQSLGDSFGVAQTKHSYANLLAKQEERWSEAEALYEDSLELGEDLGRDYHIAQVSFKYGEFLCKNRIDLVRGLSLLRSSLSLNTELSTSHLARVREAYNRFLRQIRQ